LVKSRFPRGFAKTALEIARQSGVHSREAGGALADGKTATNGLFSRYVRACSARFAIFQVFPCNYCGVGIEFAQVQSTICRRAGLFGTIFYPTAL
jgi:hypothetical protein